MRFLKEIVQGIIDDVSSTILIKDSKANKKYLKGLKEYSNAFIYHDDFDITAKRLIFVDKNRLKIGDKRYICIEYDLEDFTDENVVGHVVYFKEYTESHSRFVKQIIFVSLVSIIFLILLILIIYFGLQFYEKELTKEIKMKEEKEDLLRKQNRLAIMGEMIAMIAHQWRQPLAAIMASSQAIKLKKRLNKLTDEFEDEKLKDIENLTKHLSVTIDDFKNFFKQDKQLVVCNPAELIQKTVEFLDHRIKMNSIVVNIIDKFDSKIETYSSELLQVSMNIITNSIDELSQKEQNIKAIDITIVGDEKYLYIIISDNAGGIPLNIIGKIFEPYFSTKGKNGTGLGLYMSKVIVDKHLKGHLSVSNSIEGANFHIKIPLSC
jgi:C4-dicarboxylate-specific signal transduction histidine kinase